MKPDFRAPTESKQIRNALADGVGGMILAVAEVAGTPEQVFRALATNGVDILASTIKSKNIFEGRLPKLRQQSIRKALKRLAIEILPKKSDTASLTRASALYLFTGDYYSRHFFISYWDLVLYN